MRLRRSVIGLFSLIIGIVIYYSLAMIAIINYSGGFDIYNDLWTHLRWFEYNPDGALFFRVGTLIYAVSMVLLFLSFGIRSKEETEMRFRVYYIQIVGITMAALIIVGELLADQATMFVIVSGLSLLLVIVLLIGIVISLYSHPTFWRPSIIFFIISVALSSYLLYMGAFDLPIREFRIVDLLATVLNQTSMCVVALNFARLQTH